MARRRSKDLNIAAGVAPFGALLVAGWIFVPPVRQPLLVLGAIVFGVVFLAGVVGLGVLLRRRTKRPPVPLSCAVPTLEKASPSSLTPSETQIPQSTADLVQQLRNIDWFQFEKIVDLAYRKLGYKVTTRGGGNPDGGIDLVIEKDGQQTAIQCKHWKSWSVGLKVIREFLGALTDAGIQKGIFITLCGYSSEAKRLAEKHGIEILNESGLAKLLESSEAQLDPEVLTLLHDMQKFCPKCGGGMVLRTANKGRNRGEQFWGCSNYSRSQCRGRLSYKGGGYLGVSFGTS